MRTRLFPSIIWGYILSLTVIELIIASVFFISLSASEKLIAPLNLLKPGNIPIMDSIEPSFFICLIWSLKSSSVNSSFLSFFSRSFACFSSKTSWAFSTRETISPIPSMRETSLSGKKGSRASNFSPIPMNFIGLPVTAFIEMAAPPLASPSSFVKITPSIFSFSLNDFAMLTASCPVMASRTSSVSLGFRTFFCLTSSSIISSLIWRRPAVSTIMVSKPFFIAYVLASLHIWIGLSMCFDANVLTPICVPIFINWSIAAGL